jgi:hypothetical protein
MSLSMNNLTKPLPQHALSRESLRLTLVAVIAIALLGGLDALIAAICVGGVVLFFAGWDLPRTRAAVRSFADYILKD